MPGAIFILREKRNPMAQPYPHGGFTVKLAQQLADSLAPGLQSDQGPRDGAHENEERRTPKRFNRIDARVEGVFWADRRRRIFKAHRSLPARWHAYRFVQGQAGSNYPTQTQEAVERDQAANLPLEGKSHHHAPPGICPRWPRSSSSFFSFAGVINSTPSAA